MHCCIQDSPLLPHPTCSPTQTSPKLPSLPPLHATMQHLGATALHTLICISGPKAHSCPCRSSSTVSVLYQHFPNCGSESTTGLASHWSNTTQKQLLGSTSVQPTSLAALLFIYYIYAPECLVDQVRMATQRPQCIMGQQSRL